MSHTLPRVVLVYDPQNASDLKVLAGIAAYVQNHPNYWVMLEDDTTGRSGACGRVRGVIANLNHPSLASTISNIDVPVIGFGRSIGPQPEDPRFSYFLTDNRMIARMAFDHLFDRGFRQFAFYSCDYQSASGARETEDAFASYVSEHNLPCYTPQVPLALTTWLRSLSTPVGILAASDSCGRQILNACHEVGLQVPQDVAVIGTDNDELLCQLCTPPLSSIEYGPKEIGYQAAALLERLICGERLPERSFVVEPIGVIARQSTDAVASCDWVVAKAANFIQRHAREGIKVRDVAYAVGISRSRLEKRFAKALGYTIHTAIRRIQLEQTRDLVSNTNIPLKQIAAHTGFLSVQHMTTLFGKTFHQSPAQYRKARSPNGSNDKPLSVL